MVAEEDTAKAAKKKATIEEMEAQAVDKAKATADSSFRPSNAVLNAATAAPLLAAVDGPSLQTYEGKESVYVGRSVPVSAGGKLELPIHVTTPGSVVEYAVELANYDVDLSIQAERDEGITIVKEMGRLSSAESPLTQKFLVGAVPCVIQFLFSNQYSWMREKVVSYKITVTPPSSESLTAGRRRRATACLQAVRDDLQTAEKRLGAAQTQKGKLQEEVAEMMKLLEEKKKAWKVAEKEEEWLTSRTKLRQEQERLLNDRLQNGWEDEKKAAAEEKKENGD
eukprot:CAMPEP_0172459980 /NCGR_PEP_ID=MMETSP1065-20121228/35016_1 /TAXON_ID=265537 /ORGANISM="Amphiprora paludosa, Strain CCMP125" /LENGTH=280 /DNA_ID=CAMNT_0013214865 /DNA_START=71 /DNA_END=913 /DNA_ORIENTATION=+